MRRVLRRGKPEVRALAHGIAAEIAAVIAERVGAESDTKERLAVARTTLIRVRGEVDAALRLLDAKSSVATYRARVRNARKARRARNGKQKE